jgi:Ni2+-binding GTPase involved in maturation of urease and hydrogenase
MMTCNFEIKVALLGNVSAGKTTLLTNLTVVELISVLVTIDGTAFKWALAGDVAVKTSDPL